MHRAKTVNGKDAILVVPEPEGDILLPDECPVSFENVSGGENPPDSYLTVRYANGDAVHLGPDIVLSRTKN